MHLGVEVRLGGPAGVVWPAGVGCDVGLQRVQLLHLRGTLRWMPGRFGEAAADVAEFHRIASAAVFAVVGVWVPWEAVAAM